MQSSENARSLMSSPAPETGSERSRTSTSSVSTPGNRATSAVTNLATCSLYLPCRSVPRITGMKRGESDRISALRQDDAIQAQRLADGPGLERAAARGVRRIAVGDLADVAEPRLVGVAQERVEEPLARLSPRLDSPSPDAHPGLHEGPREPRPRRPLVVRPVALRDASGVMAGIVGISGVESPQPERRPEPLLDRVHDAARRLPLEQRDREPADGEDLVGTEARVESPRDVAAVHDVVEEASLLVPEARGEGPAGLFRELAPPLRESRANPKRVDPERLDLDGLADPRRHDTVPDLRVHPG